MTEGNTELHRLDQLGRNAAQKARQTNTLMNHTSSGGYIKQHAAMSGAALPNMPIGGRLAVPVFLAILICVFLSWGFGIARPVPFALAAVILLEISWYIFKRRRLSRLKDQAVGLNVQLHDLKEQEFQLRYEEAKRNGALDRFTKSGET